MKSWKSLEKNYTYKVTGLKSLVLLLFLHSFPVLDYFTFFFLSSNFLFPPILSHSAVELPTYFRGNRSRKELEENFYTLSCLSMHLLMNLCSAFPWLSWNNVLSLFPCLSPFLYNKDSKRSCMYSLSRILLSNFLESIPIRLLLLSIHWNRSCDR